MFGKFFKSAPVKSSKSDDFMQNLSVTKKENKPLQTVSNSNQEKLTDFALSSDIKQQIIDKGKNLNVKTCASKDFINMINEAKSKIEDTNKQDSSHGHIPSKEEQFNEVFGKGLYFIKAFTERPDNKDNLKKALNLFAEATTIKKNKAEPYYFLAYIAYLVNDIPLAEKYFKISSYLKPEQKYLMPLGRKISGSKIAKGGY